mgnify:CR=1 FL=1
MLILKYVEGVAGSAFAAPAAPTVDCVGTFSWMVPVPLARNSKFVFEDVVEI